MRFRNLAWVSFALLLPLAGLAFARAPAQARGKIASDCTFKGHKLYGKVQVVDSFPDLKVQVVGAFPDLKVQRVDVFPNKCGMWKMVDAFPDLKIQLVSAFPDITIKYVSAFPGLPP